MIVEELLTTDLLKILDQVTDPVFLMGPDFDFIWANTAYTTYMGIPHNNIISMKLEDVISLDYIQVLKNKYRQINPDKQTFNNIYPSVLPDSSIIIEKWHNEGVFDKEGNLKYYYCVASLDQQDRPLKPCNMNLISGSILRSSLIGIIVAVEDEITYINTKAGEILGLEGSIIPGTSGLADLLPVLFHKNTEEVSLPDIAEAGTESHEFWYKHPEGRKCCLSIIKRTQVYNEQESVLILIEDITDRKLNEIETEKARKILADMMRIAKVGYWEKNKDGWIWSNETYDIYEIPHGRLITEDFITSTISQEIRKKRGYRVNRVYNEMGKMTTYKFEYPIYPGTPKSKWISGEAFFERNSVTGEKRLFGWVQDISDRKKIEQELISAKEKAEESERLKANFLANMSHEIRTPLNAILGFSDLLTKSTDPEDQSKFKSIITQSSKLLLKIIDDILDFSAIESGSLELFIETVPLCEIFTEIMYIFSDDGNQDVKLNIQEPEKGICVLADRERLKQVLINLLNNAFKYTEKGSVDVTSTLDRGKSVVIFSVKDTGIGIEPEQQETIFKRFYQANSFSKGTGLGLAIVRSIINQMGGNISVKSKPGKGAEFIFSLPASVQ